TLKSRNPANDSATENTTPRTARTTDATTRVTSPTTKKVTSAPIIIASGSVRCDRVPPVLPRSVLAVRADPFHVDRTERARDIECQLSPCRFPVRRVEGVASLGQLLGIEPHEERGLRDPHADIARQHEPELAQTQLDLGGSIALPPAREVQPQVADAALDRQRVDVRVREPRHTQLRRTDVDRKALQPDRVRLRELHAGVARARLDRHVSEPHPPEFQLGLDRAEFQVQIE